MNDATAHYIRAIESALRRLTETPAAAWLPGIIFPLPTAIASDENELEEVEEHFGKKHWTTQAIKVPVRGRNPNRLIFITSAHNFPKVFEK